MQLFEIAQLFDEWKRSCRIKRDFDQHEIVSKEIRCVSNQITRAKLLF